MHHFAIIPAYPAGIIRFSIPRFFSVLYTHGFILRHAFPSSVCHLSVLFPRNPSFANRPYDKSKALTQCVSAEKNQLNRSQAVLLFAFMTHS